jgi:hypothetical protein
MNLTTIRTLPVKLTDDEVNAYARQVAEKCLRVQELEAEKAATAKQIKGLIDGQLSEMGHISTKVHRREEPRDVECHWVYRWFENTKSLVRTDTYEVVETRPIEVHEKQQRLNFEADESGRVDSFGPAVRVPESVQEELAAGSDLWPAVGLLAWIPADVVNDAMEGADIVDGFAEGKILAIGDGAATVAVVMVSGLTEELSFPLETLVQAQEIATDDAEPAAGNEVQFVEDPPPSLNLAEKLKKARGTKGNGRATAEV